jgi:hypothetical protein
LFTSDPAHGSLLGCIGSNKLNATLALLLLLLLCSSQSSGLADQYLKVRLKQLLSLLFF